MNNTVLISFIIPAYNAEKTIGNCLESIIKLKKIDYEIIVVNDGSTDLTEERCSKYSNVTVITVKNQGVSNARNIGLRAANGRYICFVDADDQIISSNIKAILQNINVETEIMMFSYMACGGVREDIVFPPVEIGNYSKEECNKMIQRFLQVPVFKQDTEKPIGGHVWRYIFKKKFLIENELYFDEHMPYAEDLCFCVAAFSKCIFFQVEKLPGYRYFINYGTASKRYRDNFWTELKNVAFRISEILGEKQYKLFYYYGKSVVIHSTQYLNRKEKINKHIFEVLIDEDFIQSVLYYKAEKKGFWDKKEEQWFLNRNIVCIVAFYKIKLFPVKLSYWLLKIERFIKNRCKRNKKNC